MECYIYLDVLLITNGIINYLLLRCFSRIAGLKPNGKREVAAALIGALFSLTIFLPMQGMILTTLAKITCCGVMVLICCGFCRMRFFLYRMFLLFTLSFLFAGVMTAIWMVIKPANMLAHNGIIYFHFNPVLLLFCMAAAYGIVTVFQRYLRKTAVVHKIYRVTAQVDKRELSFYALVDSGNGLRDAFTGTPVIVCSRRVVEEHIPLPLKYALDHPEKTDIPIRWIPFQTVGYQGILPAIRPEKIMLTGEEGHFSVEDVYLAFSEKEIGNKEFSGLIHPEIIKS